MAICRAVLAAETPDVVDENTISADRHHPDGSTQVVITSELRHQGLPDDQWPQK